jgi:hypothetical protein
VEQVSQNFEFKYTVDASEWHHFGPHINK